MELGNELKCLRKKVWLFQQEMADSIKNPQKTYSNYKSRKTSASTIQFIKCGRADSYSRYMD